MHSWNSVPVDCSLHTFRPFGCVLKRPHLPPSALRQYPKQQSRETRAAIENRPPGSTPETAQRTKGIRSNRPPRVGPTVHCPIEVCLQWRGVRGESSNGGKCTAEPILLVGFSEVPFHPARQHALRVEPTWFIFADLLMARSVTQRCGPRYSRVPLGSYDMAPRKSDHFFGFVPGPPIMEGNKCIRHLASPWPGGSAVRRLISAAALEA